MAYPLQCLDGLTYIVVLAVALPPGIPVGPWTAASGCMSQFLAAHSSTCHVLRALGASEMVHFHHAIHHAQ
jgi:hypothetical protein